MLKLPLCDFEWMSDEELETFDIHKINLDGDTGYIIECDLNYPTKLHNKHSNLPLAPEVLEIHFENLSPYAKKALLESDGQQKYKDVKLTATFHDRIDYVVHAKNLKLYLDLGMKLLKIKRVLKFRQDIFLSKYIEKCTEARQNSLTKFESNQFKKLVSLK
jgi:protein associated with RNAse G/E